MRFSLTSLLLMTFASKKGKTSCRFSIYLQSMSNTPTPVPQAVLPGSEINSIVESTQVFSLRAAIGEQSLFCEENT